MVRLDLPSIRRALAALLLAADIGTAPASAQTAPIVAAASDLKFAVEEIAAQYRRETGQDLKLFGSSGNFFQQIRQSAPFDIFMSADEDYVLQLAKLGLTLSECVRAREAIGL